MEFDKEGRIILPGAIAEDKAKDADSIILERIQVNLKNPAIARLKIYIGQNLKRDEEFLLKEIYTYCKNFMDRSHRYNDVESSINAMGTSIVIETRSSFQMYALLTSIIEELQELYNRNRGIPVSIRGSFGF